MLSKTEDINKSEQQAINDNNQTKNIKATKNVHVLMPGIKLLHRTNAISRQPRGIFISKVLDLYRRHPATIRTFGKVNTKQKISNKPNGIKAQDQTLDFTKLIDTIWPALSAPCTVRSDGHFSARVHLRVVHVQFQRLCFVRFNQSEQIFRLFSQHKRAVTVRNLAAKF